MRRPSNLLAEGLTYVFLTILAMVVVAHMAQTPRDPSSPDFHLARGQ